MLEECIREALAVMDDPQFRISVRGRFAGRSAGGGSVELGGKKVAVSGQIDRLYIGEKEVWIVDFKSNRLPPAPSANAIPRGLYAPDGSSTG